jgi:serine/threonine protein phosphatase PrpC
MAAPAHPAPCGAFATHIGGSAEQQDRAIILTLPDGTILSAVADGHGTHGARVAQWAVDWVAAHPEAPLNAATFASIDEHIRAQLLAHLTTTGVAHMTFGKGIYRPGFYGSRGLPIRGGTTLSIALVSPDGHVAAAHVGDSDIHVFDDGDAEGGPSSSAGWLDPSSLRTQGVSLMADHTPTSKAEFDRIRALHPGAKFTMDAAAIGFPKAYDRPVWTKAADGTFELNPLGPFMNTDVRESWGSYLHASDDSEGLAMTRALGDFNLQLLAGVITEPHCQELPALLPSDAGPVPPIDPAAAGGHGSSERVVVNASDGFWDIVHYAEAAEVIWRPENRGDATATAAALLALGKAKTLERLGAPGDNITVSVIRVLAPRPAPAAAAVAAPAPAPAVGGAGAAPAALLQPEPREAQHGAHLAADAEPVPGFVAPAQLPGGDSLKDPALWEAAVQRYNPADDDDCMPLGHSANNLQIAEGQDSMIRGGAVPGTGFWYHGRGSTQRIIYRSLDGRYWDIVYRRFGPSSEAGGFIPSGSAGKGAEDVPEQLWRIAGVRPWYHSPLGPALPVAAPAPPPEPEPALPAVAVAAPPPVGGAGAPAEAEADDEGPYATKEIRPCGCPMSLFINPNPPAALEVMNPLVSGREGPKNGRTASETLHGMMVRSGECKRLDWPKKPP